MPRTRAEETNKGTRRPKGISKGSYRLTCSRCRTRKVKCDGTTPECRICLAYGQPCHYDKMPPMSQVIAMARRIEDLERSLDHPENDDAAIQVLQNQAMSPAPNAPAALPFEQLPTASNSSETQQTTPAFLSTSAIQEPTRGDSIATTVAPIQTSDLPVMSEDQLSVWHTRTLEVCSKQLHIPINKVEHLLKTYWTWVFPAFMFVSRPQFLMDTATGGRFSSPLLCSVLCLQATRFTDHILADDLHSNVHFLLGREITGGPSIPLVQALLQLSARELGLGSLQQAWLHSGMAFRMAIDMGIMTKTTDPGVDAIDFHVRGQLAWSCYLWDKAVSLYLGRMPALPECPNFEPVILDTRIEEDIWEPYLGGANDESRHYEENEAWHSHQAYGASCFANFCKLGPIIHEVLVTIYAKRSASDMLTSVQQIRDRLDAWRTGSPPHLILPAYSQQCPPPHILSQNMLYHTTTILLHRPFRSNQQCRETCTQASADMECLIRLLEAALSLTRVTYLMAYCAYIAATVTILDLHDGLGGSQARLNTYLRTLYSVRASCPGIQRSIDIIVRALEEGVPSSSAVPTAMAVAEKPKDPDPLPMFPFDDAHDFSGLSAQDQYDLPFGSLDPFAMDWSLMANDVFGGQI